MLHFATTYPTQAAALKFHFDLGTSVPKGFLANGVNRIQGEHVVDLISSTEVARGKGWFVGWNGKVPPRWKKSPRWERFAPNGVRTGAIPGQQSTQNLWRTCC